MYKNRLLGGLLVFLGIGVIAYWALFILQGGMKEGLFTLDGANYIILHQAAEMIMAVASITAGTLLWRGHCSGAGAGLIACGLLLYSGVNSSAWSLRNDPALTGVFAFATAVGIYGMVVLPKRLTGTRQ